ncbi:serine hydrolase domain-containing protein [Oricola sp.]|uniref:serine hydrolase domain-containing protein n=1 Tax=Oricola sp. TaxID=1979950 RepID=UPI00351236E2
MNVDVRLESGSRITGFCDPSFREVSEAFEANFRERGEAGASLCVNVHGRTMVDLWGGVRDPETGAPWQRDTVSVVFSCTKAATAICAHMLVDRGLLDLDQPVMRYWPQFAGAGKEDITVRMLLNHTAGLPALRDRLKTGGFYDWKYMVERLEREAPFWPPGSHVAYHMMTFGWAVGEVIRRVSGRPLGQFFREEISGPLQLDFHIGAPEEIEPRIAPVSAFMTTGEEIRSPFAEAVMRAGTPVPRLAFLNTGRHGPNSVAAHEAELGGIGGIANARALAAMFAPLASSASAGKGLLSRERIDVMRSVSAETDLDETLCIPTRFGEGFMLAMDNADLPQGNAFRIGPGAFGHVGIGGSVGFADPDAGMAFGYTMNRLGGGVLLNDRGQSLVDATYRSL